MQDDRHIVIAEHLDASLPDQYAVIFRTPVPVRTVGMVVSDLSIDDILSINDPDSIIKACGGLWAAPKT